MGKIVKVEPLNEEVIINTNENLLSVLLKKDLNVLQECGARGMCSTCHVYVTEGEESLTPLNKREKRTLEVITTCRTNSRLACQARVIGEGVVVEIPAGMYLSEIDDIESLIGRRAQEDILHPISGAVLVEAGKLITRSMITQLKETKGKVEEYLVKSEEV
ncbi:MAG: (2Fe-2S)-binding protein [Gloeocapsa sp. DLM2.Bin57]|nr:MAG: (2Fe-2S)-binding protein [Gloeocapsa sp. DLM2.Bin57]